MKINIKEIPHYKYLKQIVNDKVLEEIGEYFFTKGYWDGYAHSEYLFYDKHNDKIEWVEDEN